MARPHNLWVKGSILCRVVDCCEQPFTVTSALAQQTGAAPNHLAVALNLEAGVMRLAARR